MTNNYLAFIKILSFSAKIRKKNLFSIRTSKIKILSFILVAFLANLPIYVISRKIKILGYLLQYNENKTSIEPLYFVSSILIKNSVMDYFILILTLIRGLLMLFILFISNIIIYLKLKQYLENRKVKNNINKCNIFIILFN